MAEALYRAALFEKADQLRHSRAVAVVPVACSGKASVLTSFINISR
jgi:hypothetical protein